MYSIFMIKKILPISVFILLLVIILLLGLQNMMNKNKQAGVASITPTLYQGQQGAYTPPGRTKNGTTSGDVRPEELKTKLPIISPEFTLDYSDRMQKYVATMKPDEATGNTIVSQEAYANWKEQNPSFVPLLPPENVVIAQQSVKELNEALDNADKNKLSPEQEFKKNNDSLLAIANTLFTPLVVPLGSTLPTQAPKVTVSPTPNEKEPTPKTPKTPSGSYTYYSQCSGPYDALPLPEGGTICSAGCGPTSVAMILSSYVDKTLTPPKMIDLMSKSGVHIGSGGSYISEIYSYLKGRGDVKVSSFIIPSEKGLSAQEVKKDFQGYINSGWTIFVLANFKTDGGGHYFWVTDVNDSGDILAYDPYYGKQQTPPINENRYTPAPYYRYAFAIKKL